MSTPLVHPGDDCVLIHGDENNRWNSGKLYIAITLIFLITGAVALTLLLVLHPNTESSEEYGVVLDAGSSHTALYVYKWPGDERLKGTAVPVDEVFDADEKPGISKYVNDPSDAGLSLKQLLAGALASVPHDKCSSTPVYLGATAGMRLLEEVNGTASEAIMASVRKTLSESGFHFMDSDAKIICGEDEGSFGWITANYLRQVLQTTHKKLSSLGALDLGGASTQITFVPKNISQATKHFQLYGRDYPVYTKTYLCYGLNEIYRRLLSELAKDSNYTGNVSNPCTLKGFSESTSATDIWKTPCSCQPSSPVPIGRSRFTFYGSSNTSECRRQVVRLFTHNSTCPDAEVFSSLRGNQPSVRGNFLAFSGYYFMAYALGLPSSPSMEEFRLAYETFCNKTWDQVKRDRDFRNISTACFAGHYIYTLLTQGYGFDNATWKISFKKTVDNKSVGWTLGYMINATNLIPRIAPKNTRLDDEILIPALVVCVVFILIGLFFCFKFIRRKRLISFLNSRYSNI